MSDFDFFVYNDRFPSFCKRNMTDGDVFWCDLMKCGYGSTFGKRAQTSDGDISAPADESAYRIAQGHSLKEMAFPTGPPVPEGWTKLAGASRREYEKSLNWPQSYSIGRNLKSAWPACRRLLRSPTARRPFQQAQQPCPISCRP